MYKKECKEQIKKLVVDAITNYLKTGKKIPIPENIDEELLIKRGVFVTLRKKPDNRLRGCIGRPLPDYKLADAIIDSAISSAVNDPRFPSVKYSELSKLNFEISIMSTPELIEVEDTKEYLDKIEVGKHGLIIESGFNKGLLLPQVATEYNWDVKTFLEHTCQKAGLSNNSWNKKSTKISSFYLYDKIEGEFNFD